MRQKITYSYVQYIAVRYKCTAWIPILYRSVPRDGECDSDYYYSRTAQMRRVRHLILQRNLYYSNKPTLNLLTAPTARSKQTSPLNPLKKRNKFFSRKMNSYNHIYNNRMIISLLLLYIYQHLSCSCIKYFNHDISYKNNYKKHDFGKTAS